MSDEHKSLNQIIDFRKEKLTKLRDAGVEPYPQKYEPTHFSADILGDFDNIVNVSVCLNFLVLIWRTYATIHFQLGTL